MGARRQIILMWVPNRSASNITNSEILGIHIALVHLSTRHSSCHPHILPQTHTPFQSPLQQLTWMFQAEFCDSEEVRLPQEQRTKEMLKDGETFLSAYLKCSLLLSNMLKTLKSLSKYLKHLLSGPNAPSLSLHPPSLYPSSLILSDTQLQHV